MKHLNTLYVFIFCMLIAASGWSQQRYLTPIFSDVEVTVDGIYGENFTVLTLAVPEIAKPIKENLFFDFYEPAGDTVSKRPLVLLMKTGNFLPIATNGTVQGTRKDSATVEIARRLAKAGYVVASLDYRLGWNPTAPTQPERALQLIQAAYRGVQDSRAAIRFFKKEFVEEGNPWGVDTSRITIWGMGTGGYISTGTTTLDDYNKILTTTNPALKFFYDALGTGSPNTPMVIESINGDVNGLDTAGFFAEPVPPPFALNDTLNVGNHVGYSSDFQLAVNQGGALGDLSWYDDASLPPMITFHVPTDPNAPYGDAVLTVPTTGDLIVQVQGGFEIAKKAESIGVSSVFDGIEEMPMFDEFPYVAAITQAAKDASAAASWSDLNGTFTGHDFLSSHYPFNLPPNSNGSEQGDPWNWWEPAIWDTIPNLLADPEGNISFEQSARASHNDASPEKGRTYIDTVMGFFLPRAFVALELDMATSTREILSVQEVGLSISPNPSPGVVRFNTASEYPIQHILVYDIMGRLVLSRVNVNSSYAEINKGSLPSGTYVASIRFEDGIVTRQVVFR